MTSRNLCYCAFAAATAIFATAMLPPSLAQQSADSGVRIGDSDIGGVVTSGHGPEAGVWVIAETAELPTKFTRIVVTDERGR